MDSSEIVARIDALPRSAGETEVQIIVEQICSSPITSGQDAIISSLRVFQWNADTDPGPIIKRAIEHVSTQ